MIKLDYDTYRKKVFGCYIGKCVGGTLGMKYEGNLNYNEVTYYDPVPQTMVPNDDLDFQVVNLESVLRNGLPINRYHLGEGWKYHVSDHAPDEYAPAVSNHALKIYSPLSGMFRNKFTAGMGGAIRSELWACLAPANPTLALWFAREDACAEHYGDGVNAEMFLSALESQAFVETDVATLIDLAIEYIGSCRFKRAITDVIEWWKKEKDVLSVRAKIVKAYGTKNWTDVTINLAFIVLALLYSEGDFDKAICTAVSLGYDADCTAATVGSIIGIINPDSISKKWTDPIGDKLVLSTGITNMHEPDTVTEFCENVISFSKKVKEFYSTEVEIDYPADLKEVKHAKSWLDTPLAVFDWDSKSKESLIAVKPLIVNLVYPSTISAKIGEKNLYELRITNTHKKEVDLNIFLNLPDGLNAVMEKNSARLSVGQTENFPFTVTVDKCKRRVNLNLLTICLEVNGILVDIDANLPVCRPWLKEDLKTGKKEKIEAEDFFFTIPKGAFKYTAKVISQVDKTIKLALGGTREFSVYLNGEKVFENDTSFYIPAMHRGGRAEVKINRGENIIEAVFDEGANGEFFLAFGTKEGIGVWVDTIEWCEI